MTGRQISKGHATGALVLGIIELLVGIVITICSFVLASKAEIKAEITPYWAGLTVSKYLWLYFSLSFYQRFFLFLKKVSFENFFKIHRQEPVLQSFFQRVINLF